MKIFFLMLSAAVSYAQQPGTELKMQWVVRGPGGKTGSKEEEFSKQAKPGPGRELRVRLIADRDCTVSFTGFTHDGQMLYGPPEIIQLSANVIKDLPASGKWTFEGGEKLGEMDAVIANPASPEYKQYAALVSKMKPGLPPEVLQAQAGAVREWIDGQLRSKTTAIDYTVKENPGEVGGLFRNGEFKGQSMVLPAQKTSVVRIRIQ